MASTYDLPEGLPFDEAAKWTPSWMQWLTRTHRAALSVQRSGPTAQRPTDLLWIGLTYFDTTLGKPIWVKTVPAKPAIAVWVDATGAAV